MFITAVCVLFLIKCKVTDYFHLSQYLFMEGTKTLMRKSKEDEQTLAELNSAHRLSDTSKMSVTLNELNCSCLRQYNDKYLINRA